MGADELRVGDDPLGLSRHDPIVAPIDPIPIYRCRDPAISRPTPVPNGGIEEHLVRETALVLRPSYSGVVYVGFEWVAAAEVDVIVIVWCLVSQLWFVNPCIFVKRKCECWVY